MKSRLPLMICVSSQILPRVQAAAARSTAIDVVESAKHAAAVIVDARDLPTVDRGSLPMLILHPFCLPARDLKLLCHQDQAMPAHVARFQPAVRQVRQALDDGKSGVPGLLRVHCWKPAANAMEAVAEELDLALWLFGQSTENVYAVERGDYLQVHLGFAAGGMAIFDFDATAAGRDPYAALSLIGSTGAVYADDHHNTQLLLNDSHTQAVRTTGSDTALAATIDHFARSVQADQLWTPAWRDTLRAQQTADHVGDAIRQQAVVAVGQHD